MSKPRPASKPVRRSAPRQVMDWVRIGLLLEAAILAGLVVYLRMVVNPPGHLAGWLATMMMLLWVIAPVMIAYYAARPRKHLAPRLTWGLTGFVGGAAMIAYLWWMHRGEGAGTAELGLLVLPFYLFLAMLGAQLIPVILNMVRRHKL